MSPRDAKGWRDFWRERGERELRLLLWAAWDPAARPAPDDYAAEATRVATLLGSRAPAGALEAELARIAAALGAPPDGERDRVAASKVAAWFEAA